MVECGDGSLYTGWTNHLAKRIQNHNQGKGAKYTRSRLPVHLVYYEVFATKQEAMQRECAIKKLKHKDKLQLIEQLQKDKKDTIQRINETLTDD
ncbi:MAG: GIY-YIG nuclease family protein [Clostridiales bacterium]|nr:GIY-YIG nuclease family protein [Clostridiales bacterium]